MAITSPPELEAAASADGGSRTVPRDSAQAAVSIIVPTRNEAGNVQPLLAAIRSATRGILAEVIFVDDSTDSTSDVIRSAQRRSDLTVRLIERDAYHRRDGLGGAVVAGLRMARAPWACIMDADLQHPPSIVPDLLERARQSGADLVIGSRLAPGGDATSLGPRRHLTSFLFRFIARLALPHELRPVTDPLSGLFLLRRSAVDLDSLRPDGFKILLEILARCPGLSVTELPFSFGHRLAGRSKASAREALRFLRLVVRLKLSSQPRFARFLAVGASGLVVNTLALALAAEGLGIHYLVSVAIAAVVSSTWNFAFTETWVFHDRRQSRGRLGRFLQFLMMNVGALALRGPMVFGLTAGLGVHYLLSNLLSIGALTVTRFFLSDRVVWRSTPPAPAGSDESPQPGLGRPSQLLTTLHCYEIHGIATVVSDAALPELEFFRTATVVARPSIRVRLGGPASAPPRLPAARDSKRERMLYDEGLLGLGFRAEIELGSTIEVSASTALRWSPHVLYTNLVEPILRWVFVEKGYALVHGACLDFDGRAFLITARTDTGKTTTLLQILYRQRRHDDRFAFISDDLTLLTPEGEVLTYPKPLTISRHTARAVDVRTLSLGQRLALPIQSRVHSRSGRRLAHLLAGTRLPMASINALVQYLVPPPKYHVQQLVPGVRLAHRSRLAGMVVLERSDHDAQVELDPRQAVDVLVANSEDAYGFPPYDAIKEFLYGSNGQDLPSRERFIIARALNGHRALRLSSSRLDWWRRLPAIIEERAASSPLPVMLLGPPSPMSAT